MKKEEMLLEMEELETVEALGDGAFWGGVALGTAGTLAVGAIIALT